MSPSIFSWDHDAPVSKGRVVEDVQSGVIVVVCLRREHQAYTVVHDTRQSLHEEVLGADHVGIKDADQLQNEQCWN